MEAQGAFEAFMTAEWLPVIIEDMNLLTKSEEPLHPIGIGTWGICSEYSGADNKYKGVAPLKGSEEAEIESLRYSLSKGQNHIDCAELYGGFYTDEVVGSALEGLNREDLFITDKLWKTSVGKRLVRPTVEQMLSKLNTDYLDMLYIHAPWEDAPWREAIPQIDQLIREGVVRHFAVSNFTLADMKTSNETSTNPIVANQMNYNVLYQDEVSEEFKSYCQKNDIAVVAYQPIKRGEVFENNIVRQIAEKHGATASQIALAWLLHQNMLPIPKATTKEHIDDNLESLKVQLSDEDIELLNR